jgi:hypothetical protein
MTVLEPVGRPVVAAEPVLPVEERLPEQREVATGVAEHEVDHVHRHSQRCYWDFRVARWECARG